MGLHIFGPVAVAVAVVVAAVDDGSGVAAFVAAVAAGGRGCTGFVDITARNTDHCTVAQSCAVQLASTGHCFHFRHEECCLLVHFLVAVGSSVARILRNSQSSAIVVASSCQRSLLVGGRVARIESQPRH